MQKKACFLKDHFHDFHIKDKKTAPDMIIKKWKKYNFELSYV